jgi:hypothetical protein
VPFTAGRNLVLFVTSSMLANMLSALEFRLTSTPRLSSDEPLPITLNQLTLNLRGATG